MATTVGPETTASFTDFMLELLLGFKRAYRSGGVLADQLKRGDLTQHEYDGNTARVTIMRNIKQGTGPASETGTLPVGRKIRTMKANIGIAALEHTVSLSRRLPKITSNSRTSLEEAGTLEMDAAQEAMIKSRNELLNGDGTGLLASVSASTASSGTTTQIVKVAGANMGLLYRGRVGDLLVRSSLATTKLGVIIVDVDETAGAETITVADASDDTANVGVATDNTMGFYLENSQVGSSNILQGYRAATAQSGTFQGIDRSVNKDWKAVDGRNGDGSTADLGVGIMDGAVRRRGRNLTPGQTFNSLWIGDPAVIDRFSQTLLTQSQWQGDKGTLDTGFEYLRYKGERLFGDYDAQLGSMTNIPLADVELLEIDNGPSFDQMDGSIWKRFSRSMPVEAWLIAEEQAAYLRVDRFVFINNLQAAL